MEALTIAGFVIGLLGLTSIPVSILVSRRSRQTPDLRVATDFAQVVPEGAWLLRGGLVIAFEGRPLPRVARTYIAIWNHRGDTVKGSEVLASDPLRLEVEEGDEVLQARVVSTSRSQVGLSVAPEGRTANVTFDFMDAGDGAVVEVLHYGSEAARLTGTIPGAKLSAPRYTSLTRYARQELRIGRSRRIFRSFYFVWGALGVFALLITAILFQSIAPPTAGKALTWVAAVSGMIFIAAVASAMLFRRVRALVVPATVVMSDVDADSVGPGHPEADG